MLDSGGGLGLVPDLRAWCFVLFEGSDVGGGGGCGFDMAIIRESYAATICTISHFLILGRIGPCRSEVSMDPLGTVEALLTSPQQEEPEHRD